MMNDLGPRGTLIWAIALAAGWVGIEYALYDVKDPLSLLTSGLFFFAIVFFSMLASQRLVNWLARRFTKPPPPPPEPLESTTERPDHVQKRRERERRRPRGRRNSSRRRR